MTTKDRCLVFLLTSYPLYVLVLYQTVTVGGLVGVAYG
jgi:hypothetical protein